MSRSLRVLLIAPSPEIVGGQSTQARRLMRLLQQEDGIEPRYLPFPPRFPEPLHSLQRIRFIRTVINSVALWARLLGEIPRADVIHIFTASNLAFLLLPAPALAISRLFGKKSILNYRDGRAEEHLRTWKSAKWMIGMADALVAPSAYLVGVFARYDLTARSIFNIIDPTSFTYRERAALQPKFLHNRLLEPLYNIPCALRAFALVQKSFPEASLTITSEGVCRPELEAMVRNLQLHNVRFTGWVSQQEMSRLYDEADIYLTSPNTDCMPGSLLECYASGLPVVSTRAGGIPYILFDENTGLLVDRDDHEGMARAALRLLEEEGLARHLTANGRRELKKYDGRSIAVQWVLLYRELQAAEGRRGHRR